MVVESERLKTLPMLIEAKRSEIQSLLTHVNYPHLLQADIDTAQKQVETWETKYYQLLERQNNLTGRLDSCKSQLESLQSEYRLLSQGDKLAKLTELRENLRNSIAELKATMSAEAWETFLKNLQTESKG